MMQQRFFRLLISTILSVSCATSAGAATGSASGTAPASQVVVATSANSSGPASVGPATLLPPDEAVRQVLENLPQVRSSAMNIDLAGAGKAALAAGRHEWTARIANTRRSDELGDRFNEQALTLERPVRWFGKARQDLAIGEKGVFMARAGYEDAWHEAGRGLMKDWFDALREMSGARKVAQQAEVTERLRAIAEKRVAAGEAPRLELLQADTESRRVGAMLQQAQLRQEQALQMLAAGYPGLPKPHITDLPVPAAPAQPDAFWFDKITGDNHELTLAQAEADLLLLQASRIASDRMPDPTIGLHAGRERSGREKLIGFSIAFTLPGAARSAESSSAALKAGMARERVTQMQTRIRSGAQRLITEHNRSYTLWETMQRISTQSQQQAGTMMFAYQLGEATLTDALNTRRQALDAALAAESAQIDALSAAARLQLDSHLLWSVD